MECTLTRHHASTFLDPTYNSVIVFYENPRCINNLISARFK